ncbi:MAG TPA: quinone oxidoreductase [Gemmatimonadaceae bacterium]|jgi:NADPH2:quinone reductase|nr:quinone oxidoreductase [Gemmatimonadaceae bacterium]
MKAIRVHETGGPEVLRLETVDDPLPGPGEVLVRLEAIGVNFIEIYQRIGLYKRKLPFTPGSEGAGTIAAVGPGVSEVRVGDRVASHDFRGAYAELAIASADRVVALPDHLSARDGAAAMLQGMTAHYLATSVHALQPGEFCLVHAAAGGVGLLLCQIARRRNAVVIGTVSTPEKAQLARAAGADEVILYTQQDFVAEVARITNGAKVRVVYDSVGATTFAKSLDCLAPRGLLALFGQSSGPVPPMDPNILNSKGSLFLTRPTLGHYVATRDELVWRAGEVLGWVEDGSLSLRVDREVPLALAVEAHRALEGRRTTGKVLLVP